MGANKILVFQGHGLISYQLDFPKADRPEKRQASWTKITKKPLALSFDLLYNVLNIRELTRVKDLSQNANCFVG
jgi:hypothetical protein